MSLGVACVCMGAFMCVCFLGRGCGCVHARASARVCGSCAHVLRQLSACVLCLWRLLWRYAGLSNSSTKRIYLVATLKHKCKAEVDEGGFRFSIYPIGEEF
jgi:hypothetical protein